MNINAYVCVFPPRIHHIDTLFLFRGADERSRGRVQWNKKKQWKEADGGQTYI